MSEVPLYRKKSMRASRRRGRQRVQGPKKNGGSECCSLETLTQLTLRKTNIQPPPESPCEQISKSATQLEVVLRKEGLLCSPRSVSLGANTASLHHWKIPSGPLVASQIIASRYLSASGKDKEVIVIFGPPRVPRGYRDTSPIRKCPPS